MIYRGLILCLVCVCLISIGVREAATQAESQIFLPMVVKDSAAPTPTPLPPTATPIPPTATPIPPTPTPIPPSPTPVPVILTQFYPRLFSQLSTAPFVTGNATFYVYPTREQTWGRALTGDITGSQYGFSLMLSSNMPVTFEAEIIVNGQVLATKTFTVNSSTFTRHEGVVTGIDPQTSAGDMLIFRVRLVAADANAVGQMYNGSPPQESFIGIPLGN